MSRIDCKAIVNGIKEGIKQETKDLKVKPKLVTIMVGDNGASETYVRNKERVIKECGMNAHTIHLNEDVTQQELIDYVNVLNKDDYVHGILVQLPLPKHINPNVIINMIDKNKDVDGFQAKINDLYDGDCILPCTPLGITKILDNIGCDVKGKDVMLIGRGYTIGRSLGSLLVRNGASLLHLHSKSKKKIGEYIESFKPDIIISATGVEGLLNKSMIENATNLEVIIDAGVTRKCVDGKFKIFGDFKRDDIDELGDNILITPPVGGVGVMTTTMLALNLLECYKRSAWYGKKIK